MPAWPTPTACLGTYARHGDGTDAQSGLGLLLYHGVNQPGPSRGFKDSIRLIRQREAHGSAASRRSSPAFPDSSCGVRAKMTPDDTVERPAIRSRCGRLLKQLFHAASCRYNAKV